MKKRLKAVAILALLGTPSYALCFGWHICMAGHMQHPPIPLYQWISDFWWMACFTSALVFSTRLRAEHKVLFVVGTFVLIVSRIPFGSCCGMAFFIELPFLIVIVVCAIKYLVRPAEYIITGEQPG